MSDDFEDADGYPFGKLSFVFDDYLNGSTYDVSHTIQDFEQTWPSLLSKYITFLESIYGYPIRHQVALFDKGYSDPNWDGPTFTENNISIPKSFRSRYFTLKPGNNDE